MNIANKKWLLNLARQAIETELRKEKLIIKKVPAELMPERQPLWTTALILSPTTSYLKLKSKFPFWINPKNIDTHVQKIC